MHCNGSVRRRVTLLVCRLRDQALVQFRGSYGSTNQNFPPEAGKNPMGQCRWRVRMAGQDHRARRRAQPHNRHGGQPVGRGRVGQLHDRGRGPVPAGRVVRRLVGIDERETSSAAALASKSSGCGFGVGRRLTPAGHCCVHRTHGFGAGKRQSGSIGKSLPNTHARLRQYCPPVTPGGEHGADR